MNKQGKELYGFSPFGPDVGKRLLLRDKQPVPLLRKAFETLPVLVRHNEQVVLNDDLMKTIWPDTFRQLKKRTKLSSRGFDDHLRTQDSNKLGTGCILSSPSSASHESDA